MEPIEIAAGCTLAAAFLLAVLSRAFAAFSRSKLDELIERTRQKAGDKDRPAEEARNGRGERPWHVERELAQTVSISRNILTAAFVTLLALWVLAGGKHDWQTFSVWIAGWLLAVEILGRALGTSFAEPIVLWGGGVAKVLLAPLWPLGKLVYVGATAIDRLRGKTRPVNELEEIEEEILSIVAEGTTDGVLERTEGEMIESVLNLRDADVAEIMTPRTEMISIPSSAGLEEAIQIAREAGHSRVPVFEENRDNIVGIFYVKDILHHWGKKPPPKLAKILRKPHFIPETRKVSGLLEELKRAKVHIAVVLDEYGGTAGLVTVEDIVEEIVGEITDEFDRKKEPSWRWVRDGVVEADARVHIDEVSEAFDVELPETEDYDTVGGLVISLLGHIPQKGEKARTSGLEFEVTDADARRVKLVRARRVREDEDEKE